MTARRAPWSRAGAAIARLWRDDRNAVLLGAAALALVGSFFNPGIVRDRDLYDQIVVFDITQSMNVTDYVVAGKPVSRLNYAKRAVRDSLLQLPCGSKVGVGIFTEYRSFLLMAPVEVCANITELRSTLNHVDGTMAWTGNSEIAKGLYSAIKIAGALPDKPSLVFITDGQEAPPINPRHRPEFEGKAGEVGGLLVGVGDLKPSRIPKSDPSGRPLGYWAADEVMQTDPRSQGRGGSVSGEKLSEDSTGPVAALPGASTGHEELSSLREGYLKLVAGETGLSYQRLDDPERFVQALTAPRLSRPVAARVDLRVALAALALLLVLARYTPRVNGWWRAYNARTGIRKTVIH